MSFWAISAGVLRGGQLRIKFDFPVPKSWLLLEKLNTQVHDLWAEAHQEFVTWRENAPRRAHNRSVQRGNERLRIYNKFREILAAPRLWLDALSYDLHAHVDTFRVQGHHYYEAFYWLQTGLRTGPGAGGDFYVLRKNIIPYPYQVYPNQFDPAKKPKEYQEEQERIDFQRYVHDRFWGRSIRGQLRLDQPQMRYVRAREASFSTLPADKRFYYVQGVGRWGKIHRGERIDLIPYNIFHSVFRPAYDYKPRLARKGRWWNPLDPYYVWKPCRPSSSPYAKLGLPEDIRPFTDPALKLQPPVPEVK